MTIRPQYHFRPTSVGMLVWDVRKLVGLAGDVPVINVPLDEIGDLDQPYWFLAGGDKPTCRRIAEHMKQVNGVDLSHPILRAADGRIMDGMHRVVRALVEGQKSIAAKRFPVTPPHDFKDVASEDLPY